MCANPQKEDGHVDIANEIVEALAKIHLSSYESQVLWAIFRKTYGWHKKEDWITNTQISNMTGIAETHISRTIKILIKKNLIIKTGKKLAFQKDYDQWEKLPKGVTSHHKKKLPKGVSEVTKGGKKKLPKGVDTKETKETLTKERGDIFKVTLKEFKKMRKTKKKPMTEKAITMLLNKLDKITTNNNEQIKIMEQSIFHCWDSVYPLNERNNQSDTDNMPLLTDHLEERSD